MIDGIRYRKKKSARVLHYDPWNFDAEVGDLMVGFNGTVYHLEDNKWSSASARGELYPRRIKPPEGMIGKIINGELYWVKEKP